MGNFIQSEVDLSADLQFEDGLYFLAALIMQDCGLKNEKILSFGGIPCFFEHLFRNGASEIVCLTNDQEELDELLKGAHSGKLMPIFCDAEDENVFRICLDGYSFRKAVAVRVLHHLKSPDKLLKRIRATLSSNSFLVVVDFTSEILESYIKQLEWKFALDLSRGYCGRMGKSLVEELEKDIVRLKNLMLNNLQDIEKLFIAVGFSNVDIIYQPTLADIETRWGTSPVSEYSRLPAYAVKVKIES